MAAAEVVEAYGPMHESVDVDNNADVSEMRNIFMSSEIPKD